MPQSYFHFSISERKLYLRVLDSALMLLGLFLSAYFFKFDYFDFQNSQSFIWGFLLIFYFLFFGEIFELYNLKVASDKYLTFRSAVMTLFFTVLFYVFTPFFSPILPQNRLQILIFIGALIIPLILNRWIYIQFIYAPRFLKNILVIVEADHLLGVIQSIQNKEANKIVVVVSDKEVKLNHSYRFIKSNQVDLKHAINKNYVNEIIVASSNPNFISKEINNQLIELFKKGVVIKSLDSFIEEETNKISEGKLTADFYNYFSFSKSHQNNLYLTFGRLSDILFSLIGVIFFMVFIPIVFIGNFIANKGPLFYTQMRVGSKGELFRIVKFRSMIVNAEKNGVVWAKKNDTRITTFGRLLRKSRLDEVPQFINVLKGDMSLIGPRPERPEYVARLEKELPFYGIRHVVKPGLTGWAQVMHPYAATMEDQKIKLMYDLYYIKERNMLLDLKIIIKTISTILFFRGT
ncbi:exopolysaccharide biosynthesis polyprenyl glycosylphosphotransferase [Lutibacter sp.]|uniref:exopolysaccharide biosynthesis polyprenyl glycosylphosphotransferase n=1 Tax=Lutibacter sp. TaxID=1925666 RepID=UPI002734BD2F|nr:exopolysaccharide biosynthesis polyprenyl glycosylphosphotransferase [Lutibacter sp.]MDP3312601.1 exopolysaccharide biosynthesis polyprenyl glycosylphosphotransferase [Lutibacter sp.]